MAANLFNSFPHYFQPQASLERFIVGIKANTIILHFKIGFLPVKEQANIYLCGRSMLQDIIKPLKIRFLVLPFACSYKFSQWP